VTLTTHIKNSRISVETAK
jgi:hypothetical protein